MSQLTSDPTHKLRKAGKKQKSGREFKFWSWVGWQWVLLQGSVLVPEMICKDFLFKMQRSWDEGWVVWLVITTEAASVRWRVDDWAATLIRRWCSRRHEDSKAATHKRRKKARELNTMRFHTKPSSGNTGAHYRTFFFSFKYLHFYIANKASWTCMRPHRGFHELSKQLPKQKSFFFKETCDQ